MDYFKKFFLRIILFIALPAAFLAGVFEFLGIANAALPSIVSWSSAGGITANKDNDQDAMYLAGQGDALVFSVTIDQEANYEWTVNKEIKQTVAVFSTSDVFNWTVPGEKGIWEIHLKAWNSTNEEVHKEWVISTLSLPEAPVFFDYFSDTKYSSRTEKDPWERNLPAWNATGSWSISSGEARTDAGKISSPLSVVKGTWKLRYRYVNSPPTADYSKGSIFTFITKSNGSSLYLNNPTDGHWWVDFWAPSETQDLSPRVPQAYPYVNMVGSQIGASRIAGNVWHEVVFIRDDKEYTGTWLDGSFVEYSRDKNSDISDNVLFSAEAYGLAGYTLAVDSVEVYNEIYSIPNKSISYNAGLITVKDYSAMPKQIAEAVNNPAVFSYDQGTGIGVSYADILIKSGAKLEIKNETLKIAGGKKIMYEREAMFFFDNATVASNDSAPWYFQISGASAYAAVVLSAINSHLDNFGGFSATGMKTLYLKDSQFTDLVGANPFSISFRRPTNGELLISGSLFRGKTGTETIYLQGGDQFNQLIPEPCGIDVVDTVFENIKLFRQYDYPYYLSPGRPGGTINLTNTKTNSLQYSGSLYRYKYYLDVKVVNELGDPVPGATVKVTNELDDIKYPAENLIRSWKYFKVGSQASATGEIYFSGQQGNWFKGLEDANNFSSTTTGADGHTPPPSDISNTLVITDFKDSDGSISGYTYSVLAEKDGSHGEINGINPDETWYRSDPNIYQKTVTVVLSSSATAPSIPFNFQAVYGNESAALAWEAPYDGGSPITNYMLYRGTSSGSEIFLKELGNVTAYTDTGLVNKQRYYYKISAKNIIGEGAQSGEISGMPVNYMGYWNFDEGTGSVAADSSGNNNNGTIGGGAAWVSGKIGSALQFDGINDQVNAGNGSSLNIANAITIEAWVKSSVYTGYKDIVIAGSTSPSYGLRQTWGGSGSLEFKLSGTAVSYRNNSVLWNGAWHYIVGTWNGTHLNLFVDGASVAAPVAFAGPMMPKAAPLYIGYCLSRGEYFNGSIDEVKIYNRAISASEILANYNAVLTPPTPTPTSSSNPTPTPSSNPTPTPTPSSNPTPTPIINPGGGGGNDIAPSPDTTFPVISSISSLFITANSAIISWDTNEPSNSQVEYGLSSGYGFQTKLFPNQVNYHVVELPNLSSTIVYHYRVISIDSGGNKTVSGDQTFTTLAGGDPSLNGIPVPPSNFSYPDLTLLKIPESHKIYVLIQGKKKWISTPEVFETLGYQWTAVTLITKADLDKILDFEDNLIRAKDAIQVYLVVNGIRHHIPNPDIFLDYGFAWDEVKEVPQETIDKYRLVRLIKESGQAKIYYLSPLGVKKWVPTLEIFSSYNNKWEDIQVVSKKELESYKESNLMRYGGKTYLIEGAARRLIPSDDILKRYDLSLMLDANKTDFDYYKEGSEVR